MNYTICDVRTMKCPLAFVKAKQALINGKTKVFLFDDDISLYNFCQYLDKQNIPHSQSKKETSIQIELI